MFITVFVVDILPQDEPGEGEDNGEGKSDGQSRDNGNEDGDESAIAQNKLTRHISIPTWSGSSLAASAEPAPDVKPQPKEPYQEGFCFYVVWDTSAMCSSKAGAAKLDMSSELALCEIIDFRLLPQEMLRAKAVSTSTSMMMDHESSACSTVI